ncbi:MAG: PAS domain S-box protein [Lentisphaerae bacterium]|nr:PAS domain S-box protein [Lentisphaerota bacterium]
MDKLIDRLDRLDPESLQTHFLRLAQERGLLETIFQSIQEGVIVIGGTGALNYANKAAESMLGFSMETSRGRPISRILREIDWQRVLELDEGEWSRLISREIEIRYPERRIVNFYVVPLATSAAGEKGAVVILRDVTRDRVQEASTLEHERLDAVKLLAAGVAHEIGNPLNALGIHLQLLEREICGIREACVAPDVSAPDAETVSENMDNLGGLVKTARDEVARLDVIITQFLRAIRPSKPSLALSRIDKLLTETLNLMQHEVENRSIEIEVERAKSIPRIRVDPGQIKQVFFNVASNALQAMPDGGSLRIVLSSSDRFVVISFRDTGKGIKPEDLGRVFEPYHTTRAEGSGLGLMVVQRIVQDHGGQIEIVSKPDEGTNVTILLPLADRRVRLLEAPGGTEDRPEPGAVEEQARDV